MKSSGLPSRLRQWREENGDSYRDFAGRINEHLPEGETIGFATLRDWEQEGASGPRAPVLEALRKAFPELRLEWLLFGEGRARKTEEVLSAEEEVELQKGEDAITSGRFPRWPTVQELPPVPREMFYKVVSDLFHSATDLDELDEEQQVDLLEQQALGVQNLLMIPLHSWGFSRKHELSEREYGAYVVALLHALSLVVSSPRQGASSTDFKGSLLDTIQEFLEDRLPVEFPKDEPDGEG